MKMLERMGSSFLLCLPPNEKCWLNWNRSPRKSLANGNDIIDSTGPPILTKLSPRSGMARASALRITRVYSKGTEPAGAARLIKQSMVAAPALRHEVAEATSDVVMDLIGDTMPVSG